MRIRGRKHHLFTLAVAAELLLVISIWVLWVHRSDNLLSIARPDGRYTLRIQDGRVWIYGPPKASTPTPAVNPRSPYPAEITTDPLKRMGLMTLPPGATPAGLVATIRNDQVLWDASQLVQAYGNPLDGPLHSFFSPRGAPGTATQALAPFDPLDASEANEIPNPARQLPFNSVDLKPALLAALEDPDRWIAAHVLLERIEPRSAPSRNRRVLWGGREVEEVRAPRFEGPFAEPWVYRFAGLRAELRPHGQPYEWTDRTDRPAVARDRWTVTPCTAWVDPAQMSVIRDEWHRRLDQPVASLSWRWILAAALVLPVAWLMKRVVRAVKRINRAYYRDRGLCPACGYDLRASPDRCPECGATADA